MFRRQLSGVLLILAACIVLQGVGAVFALREAERQVVRGRVASDIHQGFLQLLATKQRLRSWVTQHKIGAGGHAEERDDLLQQMQQGLGELALLAQKAAALGLDGRNSEEHTARTDALQVLGYNVHELGQALMQLKTLPADMPARLGWDTLTEVFDKSEGRDLRELIAQSITRESAAMQRERLAADATLDRIRWLWIGMALTLALLALGATLYFARALRRPMDELVQGAHMLGQGLLKHRVPLNDQDEFSDVARSMNAMAAALEKHQQQETEHRQRLETEVRERTSALHEANQSLQQTDTRRRTLLADISHELRTPTTAIRGEAEITLRGGERSAAQYREALQRIVATSRQLGSVIDDLLAMARSDMESLSMVHQRVDMSEPLGDALAQAQALAGERHILINAQAMPPSTVIVTGDAQRLSQLMLLMLDNAVRYSHPTGCVSLRWWCSDEASPTMVLEVVDQGIGIPAEELHQVFDRHFRGRMARLHRAAGSGLGLPIAKALAQAHGGSLTLESPADEATGTGTRVQLCLPLLHGQTTATVSNPMVS
ncbi:HAMP domain-containing sensor histidine kinase [Limnohabitans sp. Rim8]|uniref:sensor histidine kinase n=1 Tax=Limnohabitans sp. Rim8 TaxID=1100718 RepID=UPI0025DE81E9|nr:HAMP domain-containing sensor histidine kinase [Limnohabitans sp. Rim8]